MASKQRQFLHQACECFAANGFDTACWVTDTLSDTSVGGTAANWKGKGETMESPVLTTPFEQALEMIEQLPAEDQENLIEIVQRRLIEQRRAEIARNASATLQAFREGRARYGTVDDLRRDLLSEP
jgi:hypothetical protein